VLRQDAEKEMQFEKRVASELKTKNEQHQKASMQRRGQSKA